MSEPTAQVDQSVVGSPANLSFVPTDQVTEEPLTAVGPVTVKVTDGAADLVATLTGAVGSDGVLTVTVPAADLSVLDEYEIEWQATIGHVSQSWTTALEVVGGFYFTAAQFRALGKEFVSTPAENIYALRRLVEGFFERHCHVAFVPRSARCVVRGDGTPLLILPHVEVREIYELVVATPLSGAALALTPTQIAALDQTRLAKGLLGLPMYGGHWPDVCGRWNRHSFLDMHYAHGKTRVPPTVQNAALRLVREYVNLDGRVPPRAVLQATEFGNFRISTPGPNTPTGIPDIDEVIQFEKRSRAVI